MLLVTLPISLLLVQAPAAPDAGLLPPPKLQLPTVRDPLLAPPPPAAVVVKSWDEARTLLRRNASDDRSAAGAVEQAQGRSRQALAALLPNLRGSASVIYDLLNPDTPPVGAAGGSPVAAAPNGDGRRPSIPLRTASASLTQSLLDVAGWKVVGATRDAARSAEATRRDVQRRLTLGLAQTLIGVVAAERVAELNRLGLQLALERAALITRTEELGAATRLDVVRVQRDVESARGTLIAGDEQLARAREAAGLAVGLERAVGLHPSFKLDGLVEEVRRACKVVKAQARADVEAAQLAVDSARKGREQASAGYLPTIGLSSNLTGYGIQPGFGRFASWSIGAVLSVPIWEGGARGGLVQERRGAETQSLAALDATRREVAFEVARARRGVQVAAALVASAQNGRTLAAQLDTMTRRAFEVGRGNSLELVDSAAALRQAEILLATREFELVQARVAAQITEARCSF
jgi:outer membrane protein TolC